jgi:hypothetical protein
VGNALLAAFTDPGNNKVANPAAGAATVVRRAELEIKTSIRLPITSVCTHHTHGGAVPVLVFVSTDSLGDIAAGGPTATDAWKAFFYTLSTESPDKIAKELHENGTVITTLQGSCPAGARFAF